MNPARRARALHEPIRAQEKALVSHHDTTPTSEDRAYARRLCTGVGGEHRAWLAAELIGGRLGGLRAGDEHTAAMIRRARALYETYSEAGR